MKKKDVILDKQLFEIIGSTGMVNALHGIGVYTLRHFHEMNCKTIEEIEITLLKITNFGKKRLRLFKEDLKSHKLTLKDLLVPKEVEPYNIIKKQETLIKDLENRIENMERRLQMLGQEATNVMGTYKGLITKHESFTHYTSFAREMNGVSQNIHEQINAKLIEFHKLVAILEYKVKEGYFAKDNNQGNGFDESRRTSNTPEA